MIAPASLSGVLRDFDLSQVISVLEYSHVSGSLRVAGDQGKGCLTFLDGQLAGAEAGGRNGELAAYLLLSSSEGTFSFFRESPAGERQEMRSNQSLVLEAARLLDESRSRGSAFVRTGSAAPGQALNGARRIYSILDSARSPEAIAASLGITKLEALYHLEALERLGAAVRCDPGSEVAPAPARTAENRIRVLVVDDSPLMQRVLARIYESDPGFVVVGTARDGREGLELLGKLRPDLVSLDLFMPLMDGPATLKHIMLTQPTPTIVVTSASPEALAVTFESILRFGAIDFITKPSRSRGDLEMQTKLILERARKAARVNLRGLRLVQPPLEAPRARAGRVPCQGILVADSGMGGGLSLMQLLTSLPLDLPYSIVGTVPLPEDFLSAFVAYMKEAAPIDVEIARDGTRLEGGVCYLAGSDSEVHLLESSAGPAMVVEPTGPLSTGASAMMDAARLFGPRAAAIVLSGGGDDALAGLAAIRNAGGITLAQLPATCVDPERSEKAIAAGLVDRVVLPSHISGSLSQLLFSRSRQGTPPAKLEEVAAPWPEKSA